MEIKSYIQRMKQARERERKEYLSSNELYLQQRCRTTIIVNC